MAAGRASGTSILKAGVIAGVVAAAVEMVFVLPIQDLVAHNSPVAVFQSIAYGALGKSAFAGGLGSAALGVFFHTLISVVAGLVYAFAAAREDVLLRRPIISGLAFGCLVYIVMNFAVLPASQVGFGFPKAYPMALLSFSIHLVGFGLPIALTVRAFLGGKGAAPAISG